MRTGAFEHAPETTEILLSIVAPAHNEQDNIDPLVEQVGAALDPLGIGYELVIVDDGSTDATRERVIAQRSVRPWVRCLYMTQTPAGRGNGQSAAFYAGFRASRGELIATLDADLQNDPSDLPAMLRLLEQTDADFVQGDRTGVRRRGDSPVRLVGSWVGRRFRRLVLGDTITDTGCSLRIMKREVALRLPLELRGMHRFIPVTARQLGYTVVEMAVNHRPRHSGTTKYGWGITPRALPGLIDLFAVRYMRNRRRSVASEEAYADALSSASPREHTHA